jgi:hypothetical protein
MIIIITSMVGQEVGKGIFIKERHTLEQGLKPYLLVKA